MITKEADMARKSSEEQRRIKVQIKWEKSKNNQLEVKIEDNMEEKKIIPGDEVNIKLSEHFPRNQHLSKHFALG